MILKRVNANVIKLMFMLSVVAASLAANTTCHWRYYQEKSNSQLDSLRKYHD